MLNLFTCFRVKRTCLTSSLTIIYSQFLISWRQLPAWKRDTNISCKPPWKRYQCRTLDSITSSRPCKTKNVNISTLQSVKLSNYLYGNEFEGCNILRISQICPKFAKCCTRNVTSAQLTVKPIYILFRRLARTIQTCVRIIPLK